MRRTVHLPLAIFLLLCGFFLLTMSGHTYSTDEETMYAVTRGIATGGDVAVLAPDGSPLSALRPGRDGRSYSPYGLLPSLLALPLYGLGAAIGGAGGSDYAAHLLIAALNGPITAATAALLAAWALRIGARRTWAIGLALLYALGTFAWPYARTFFSEPLAGLLLLLAAERANASNAKFKIENAKDSGQRDLFLSGLAAGLLITTRLAAGVALPVIGLYVLWIAWRSTRRLKNRPAIFPFSFFLFPWFLGLLPGIALQCWYNYARFGTFFASGYASETGLFTTPLAVGLYGLLLSPGKSVLLFAPALLLGLPGGWILWRRGRADLVLLCLGLFLSHLLLYSMWGEWEGGGVWGPRFLLPVVAPLLLLGAGLELGAVPLSARRLLPVVLLAVLGFAGNLGGVLLNFSTYLNMPGGADKVYSLEGSPLLAHWRILGERWGRYTTPVPLCRLGDGFYPSESPEGAALPRRSGAQGVLYCDTSTAALLSFRLDDRRPPEAAPSELRLLLDGHDLATPPSGELRIYRIMLPKGAISLSIEAHTWNPLQVGFSERNDELGPQLSDLQGKTVDGKILSVVDTAIAPLSPLPRPRWAWYYDPPNQHLIDHWAWYFPRSELSGARAWGLAVVLVLAGGGLMGAGWWKIGRCQTAGRGQE